MRPLLRPRSLLAAPLLLALAACAPTNAPTGYTDVVKANFIAACTGDVTSPSTTIASQSYCECAYQTFVDNVPYNDEDKKNRDGGQKFANYDGKTFVQVEDALRADPNALPDPMKSRLNECGSGTTGGTTPGTTPEGTTPEGTTPAGGDTTGTTAGTVAGSGDTSSTTAAP